ncbi:hypothetical protein ABZS61_33520 [Streptomyces sp. NPDC005566]|uniref:hypothetical protein n=1 Tax=Streptomyces sp. NPDC005566 TaxID=3156886 RepID=UPI0033B213EC
MSQDMAVHHAGVAAEHLLKAYLANLHPALIVEAKDFSSMLHATGHGAHASAPKSQAKTIGLIEAYLRVSVLLKGKMPVSRNELQPVADARNGVAHAAFHDSAQVNPVFTTSLRVIDTLLPALDINILDSYWGTYEGLHDRLLDQRVEEARVHLEGQLAKARRVFDDRYGHLRESKLGLILEAVARSSMVIDDAEHREMAECPACESYGWLGGDIRHDLERDIVMLTPTVFSCVACELHLQRDALGLLPDPLTDEIGIEKSVQEYYEEFPPSLDLDLDLNPYEADAATKKLYGMS